MKFWIAVSAALAVMSLSRASVADVYRPAIINPAYHVALGPLTPWRPRIAVRYEPHYGAPVACEAVMFPRSPLCAGRPAHFSPYSW
jgi:hypothetical protein